MLIRPDIFTKALHTCKCIQASMESLYPILMRICLNTVEKWYNYVQENWHTLKPGSKVAVLNNGEGLCNISHGCEQGNRPRPYMQLRVIQAACQILYKMPFVRSYYLKVPYEAKIFVQAPTSCVLNLWAHMQSLVSFGAETMCECSRQRLTH